MTNCQGSIEPLWGWPKVKHSTVSQVVTSYFQGTFEKWKETEKGHKRKQKRLGNERDLPVRPSFTTAATIIYYGHKIVRTLALSQCLSARSPLIEVVVHLWRLNGDANAATMTQVLHVALVTVFPTAAPQGILAYRPEIQLFVSKGIWQQMNAAGKELRCPFLVIIYCKRHLSVRSSMQYL